MLDWRNKATASALGQDDTLELAAFSLLYI